MAFGLSGMLLKCLSCIRCHLGYLWSVWAAFGVACMALEFDCAAFGVCLGCFRFVRAGFGLFGSLLVFIWDSLWFVCLCCS